MEVEWEDGTGERQKWSSWQPSWDSSWYGAEKLLPSGVYDISVRFKMHVPGGPWPVLKVDHDEERSAMSCCNVPSGDHVEEVIRFRSNEFSIAEGVDTTFELKGPATTCYLFRAWNAANSGTRKDWEVWEDICSRPVHQSCSETLDAADSAAPLSVALGHPALYFKCTTKRMCGALRALLNVHRETLHGLLELDHQFTSQWVGANVGNTTSASLGIASAVWLFVALPVGIGLGVGSAVTAGVTWAGDVLADRAHHSTLRKQLSRDLSSAFVVSELVKEWVQAQQTLGSSGKQELSLTVSRVATPAHPTAADHAIDGGLAAGSVVNGAAAHIVAGASQVAGIAGALIQTGVAIRGWTSMNSGQQIVRDKIRDMSCRILQIQHLLAAVDRLECDICSDSITLADDVRRCKDKFHCFHARCIERVVRLGKGHCPNCSAELSAERELMVESAANYKQSLQASIRVSGSTSCLRGVGCCNIQRVAAETVRA